MEQDFQTPHWAPQAGGPELGRRASRTYGFEGQWGLLLGDSQGYGK